MKKTLALLALILIIPLVSAELIVNKYTNDFTLSSPNNEQLKLCSCETKVDTLIVENTGQFASDYEITVTSDYPRRVRLAESRFSLAPKHFKELNVYIEESCGVTGTFSYRVTAVNSYGRIEQLDRSIRVDVCQAGLLTVTPNEQTVGLCDDATFSVTTKNVGTYAERFTLDIGHPDAALQELFLAPGEERTQDVTLRWACTEYGDRSVPFTLVAASTGPQARADRTVHITNEYGYSVELATAAEACAQATTYVPITITNDAPVPDDVTVTLSGSDVATFDGSKTATLSLAAGEERQLSIALAPETSGAHMVTVTTKDAHGNVMKTRSLGVHAANCYDPAVELRIAPDQALQGTDVDCCGQKTYYMNVRNDGDREQVFQLALDGPSIFTLDDLTVRVMPGENVNIPIRADLPCTDETYETTAMAWPVGQPQVNASATLRVESWSQRACYSVQIDNDELKVQDDMTVMPVIVRHTGLKAANYTITSNSTLFGFRETAIELRPGEERAIHLAPAVTLAEQERGRYLVSPTFTEDVQGIPYNEFLGVQLKGKGIVERFLDWLFSLSLAGWTLCARIVIVLGVLLALMVFALLLVYLGKLTLFSGGLPRGTIIVLRTVLIALAIILLLTLAFLKAPDRAAAYERVATSSGLVLEWYQNEQLLVDLDQYFADPDADRLTYTASQPTDIDARIEGSWLTLTPDMNFAGENAIVITASDSKGGITDSPPFTLRVIPRKELTCMEWIALWCKHLVVGILLCMVFVLALALLTVKEKRQDLRTENVIVVVPAAKRKEARAMGRARKKAVRKARPKRAATRAVAKTASRAVVPRTIVVGEPARIGQPVRETREGQTVNIAVGAPIPVPGAKPSEVLLIGSKTGNTVHTPYCMIARRIPKGKRVAFGTRQEALKAGLVPCKGCRPF